MWDPCKNVRVLTHMMFSPQVDINSTREGPLNFRCPEESWPKVKARGHFFKEWVNYSLWISALHCFGSWSWIKYLSAGTSCIRVLGKGQPSLGAWKVFWHNQHSKGTKSPLLQQAISSPQLISWNRKEMTTACKSFPTHLKYWKLIFKKSLRVVLFFPFVRAGKT